MPTRKNLLEGISNPFIWFDLDDTIWDMTGNSCIALEILYDTDPSVRRAFGHAGLQQWMDVYHAINSELWRGYDSGSIDRATLRLERFARPLQQGGLSREEAVTAARRLDKDYLYHLGNCPGCIPGAHKAVEIIAAAGLPMGIVSNGFREVQYRKLHSGGFDGVFHPVVLSDDTGVNKPDAGFFAAACRAAGVEPKQCVIVGDNARTDIAGALNAGWAAAVWLDDGRTPAEPQLRAALGADPRCRRTDAMEAVPAILGL